MKHIVIVKNGNGLVIAVIAFMLFMLALVIVSRTRKASAASIPGQRFEVLAQGRGCIDLKQFPNYLAKDNENCLERKSRLWNVEVLHDKESGVEFICAFADNNFSCFATGRVLK